MLFSCRRIKKKTLAILYCTSINISLGWSWLQLGIITLIFSTLDKYHIISSNFIGRESKKHLLLSLSSKELPILKKKNQNSTSLIISTQNILVRSTMELIWSNCTTLMLFWSKLLHLGKLLPPWSCFAKAAPPWSCFDPVLVETTLPGWCYFVQNSSKVRHRKLFWAENYRWGTVLIIFKRGMPFWQYG